MIWPHDECGCHRAPLVGARYRRRSIDAVTGAHQGWRFYTVESVEPINLGRLFCRKVHLRADDGGRVAPQIQQLFEDFDAIENVVPFSSQPLRQP